jgi:hypothetical protein
VVDSVSEQFTLSLDATASVLAVNEALVSEVMVEQLRGLVPPGATLVAQTIESSHTAGQVEAGTITFNASVDGSAYRLPERETLLSEVRGLPVAEARAIIARYGSAELTVWPDFVDRVPDQPARINLTILPPVEES